MSALFPSPWCPSLHFFPGKALSFKAELLVKSFGIGLHLKLCSCKAGPTPKTELSRESGSGASSSRAEPQASGLSPRCCPVAISVSDTRALREAILHGTCTHHLLAQVPPQGGSFCALVQPCSNHFSWALQKLTSGENPFPCQLNPPPPAKQGGERSCPASVVAHRGVSSGPFQFPTSLPTRPTLQAGRLCSRMRCLPRQGAPMLPAWADCQPDNRAPGSLPSPPAQTNTERVGRAGVEM